MLEAGIPSVCYGPGDIYLAHGADERVPIAELVACAQGIALAALRFCGANVCASAGAWSAAKRRGYSCRGASQMQSSRGSSAHQDPLVVVPSLEFPARHSPRA